LAEVLTGESRIRTLPSPNHHTNSEHDTPFTAPKD
jgi:hypothetical protein